MAAALPLSTVVSSTWAEPLWQKEHGIEDSAENFLNYMMQMAGPSANVDALKLIAEQSEDIYNWCLEQGIDFSGEVLEAHLPDGEEGICLGYTATSSLAKRRKWPRRLLAVMWPSPRRPAWDSSVP